ncbi:MAG: peptidoglycan DD-metalloendopeptidase family protein [Bacteroidetes bacterium]|nr:peptidoglycan DD-metalloendopeptidase family protein [Bacteroidota bacterium]
MKIAHKFLISCLLLGFSIEAQNTPDNLKKEQRTLEKKISQTKSLLKKVQSNSKNSLHEMVLLDNQIKSREALVRVFDSQIRMAEIKMITKKNEITRLKKRLIKLRNQYKLMLKYAYKKRNNLGKLMFLLSAKSYQEAMHRNSYLKKVARLNRRQAELIKQNQHLIEKEILSIEQEKNFKTLALNEKRDEKTKIETDKAQKEKTYNKLKLNEKTLLAQLNEAEKKRRNIESKIQQAILEETRKEEARKKAKEEAKTKATTKTTTPTPKPSENTEKTVEVASNYKPETLSSEGAVAGKNFEANKGLMPSPVIGGSITSRFGKNAHPTLKDVYENNNGIDLSCSAGSSVRCIFEGVVSSILSIAGAGKVVIIKHGNYRSVYSNLSSVAVSTGQLVSTKQNLGTLLTEENISVLHFEIHSVNGMAITPLNPSLWLKR